jgi:hypothetical protein
MHLDSTSITTLYHDAGNCFYGTFENGGSDEESFDGIVEKAV